MTDVRLIDANALIKHYSCVEAQKSSAEKIRAEIIVQALEKAPTIDLESLRPVGEWKLHNDGSGTCSRCHFKQRNVWDYDSHQQFCGVCGARMKVG